MSAHISVTAPGRAFELALEAFESAGAPTRTRGEDAFMASCPLHDDTTPSLSITWKSVRRNGSGGVVLLHCFSCNASAQSIAAAVGLRLSDLFDEPLSATAPNPTRGTARRRAPLATHARSTVPAQHHGWRRVRVYTYTTADGRPVQQVIREECTCNGAAHKRFLQRYRMGREWVWRKPQGFQPVLYRAAALVAAGTDQWVWLTEGEKDAETATRLGLLATTNAQGAKSFPAELAAALHGRNVAIVVDRDTAGYQRAASLHEQLQPHAAQTVILLPAVTVAKADLTDHVQAGHWDGSQPFGGFIEITPERLADLHDSQTGQAVTANQRSRTSHVSTGY
ncbi:MAG: hypothetical protein JWR37_5448 [Mycobacterium sp.]|nr:hypothetical protein [Mycobacterium sp.]